jgi:hypothetical protein
MLFKSTTEILDFADISSTVNFASLKPTLRNVEHEYIVPVIGTDLYNSLSTDYALAANEAALTAAQRLLLEACRFVIAPYVCYHWAPKSDVKLSDSGMQRMETTNNKSAFQEQRTEFREAHRSDGEKAIEHLLLFLETNKSAYPQWVDSAAFAQYRSLFIKSAREFDNLFFSHSPYRNYYAMRSKMVDVEEKIIAPAIGSALYDYLKAKDKDSAGTFSTKEQALLFKLKKAIAALTVATAVPFLNIRMDANGFTVVSQSNRSTNNAENSRTAAADNSISAFILSAQDAGATWISNAKDYLVENHADFPAWPYETLIKVSTIIREDDVNRDCSGAFGLC